MLLKFCSFIDCVFVSQRSLSQTHIIFSLQTTRFQQCVRSCRSGSQRSGRLDCIAEFAVTVTVDRDAQHNSCTHWSSSQPAASSAVKDAGSRESFGANWPYTVFITFKCCTSNERPLLPIYSEYSVPLQDLTLISDIPLLLQCNSRNSSIKWSFSIQTQTVVPCKLCNNKRM